MDDRPVRRGSRQSGVEPRGLAEFDPVRSVQGSRHLDRIERTARDVSGDSVYDAVPIVCVATLASGTQPREFFCHALTERVLTLPMMSHGSPYSGRASGQLVAIVAPLQGSEFA